MPPKKQPPVKEGTAGAAMGADAAAAATKATVNKDDKMQAAMDKFAAELNKDSDEESAADDHFNANGSATELSDAEKELIREELKKTEDEINTLRQVLTARQKHAADLKRKLGISPLTELTADFNQSLQHVKETQAYQKTTEVAQATADTMKHKWNDMRNSSLFKSFESKLGSAYTNAKLVASTSIDQLSGHAKPGSPGSSQADPTSPSNEKSPLA